MSRITGTDAANLMEAYNAVYTNQEEVVEEEIVNEDLIGDIRANAGRVVRGIQSASGAANRAAGAVNQAMVNRITPKPTAGDYKSRFARPMNDNTPRQTGRGTSLSRPQIGSLPSSARQVTQYPQGVSTGVGGGNAAASRSVSRPSTTTSTRPASRPAAPATSPRPASGTPSYAGAQGVKPVGTPLPANAVKPVAGAPAQNATFSAPAKPVPSTAAPASGPQLSARAQALKAGGPKGGARERMLNQDLDLFDVIKGYLLDEGYADTNKAALAIMANMSEEWKQSIVEG